MICKLIIKCENEQEPTEPNDKYSESLNVSQGLLWLFLLPGTEFADK